MKPVFREDEHRSAPLRILQVFTILHRAGAESMIMNYYRHIDRSKVQFDFLVHRLEEGAFEKEIEELGGRVYRLPPITSYRAYKLAVNNFFKSHSYAVVHTHIDAYAFWILKTAKRQGVPLRIAHSHIAVQPLYQRFFLGRLGIKQTMKELVQYLLRYGVRKYANQYFACGEKAGKWMYGSRDTTTFKVINNAIETSRFRFNPKERLETRKSLGIAASTFVIGHVGRFAEQKNHSFLLKIAHQALQYHQDLILILVGDGPLKKQILNEAKDLGIVESIKFLGIRNDIPQLLQAFDVFLFPSLFEGLPVTLIEAQVSGLPILASAAITKEVNLVEGLMDIVDLDRSAQEWAQLLLEKLKQTQRFDYSSTVKHKGYDIQSNAQDLQYYYLEALTKK